MREPIGLSATAMELSLESARQGRRAKPDRSTSGVVRWSADHGEAITARHCNRMPAGAAERAVTSSVSVGDHRGRAQG